MRVRSRIGFVYAIQSVDGGPVKIGWSEDPEERVKQLQGGHHSDLRVIRSVVASRRDEARLHGELADLRLRGEWFTSDPDRINASFDRLKKENARHVMTIPRAVSLTSVRDGMARVSECESEDEAAEIMASVGRALFRARIEYAEKAA